MYSSEVASLPVFASFLHHIASALGLFSYCDQYSLDHPTLLPPLSLPPPSAAASNGGKEKEEKMECLEQGEDTPPHLMSHLNQILSRGGGGEVSKLTISHISRMAVSNCSLAPGVQLSTAQQCLQENSHTCQGT